MKLPKFKIFAVHSVVFICVAIFYACEIAAWDYNRPGQFSFAGFWAKNDAGAYGALADAFLHGQVALRIEPDPKLAQASDPYLHRLEGTNFLWDICYYKSKTDPRNGKYYLYFGPTPPLVINCPIKLLTGLNPSVYLVIFILSLVNYLFFALLLRWLICSYFSSTPWSIEAAALVLYACCNLLNFLQSSPNQYQTAEASAVTFVLAYFYFILRGLSLPNNYRSWFFAASCALGLAFGSKITNLFLYPTLVFVAIYLVRKNYAGTPCLRRTILWDGLALFFVPILCLVAYAWYNEMRFESPLEFGPRYILNGGDVVTFPNFRLAYIPDGWVSYFICPPRYLVNFPFIDAQKAYAIPWIKTFHLRECYVGLLVFFPIHLFIFKFLFSRWRQFADEGQEVLLCWLKLVFFWFLSVSIFYLSFYYLTLRYEVEIQLPLLLLTCTTVLWCLKNNYYSFRHRLALVVFAVFSAVNGIFLGFIGNGYGAGDYLNRVKLEQAAKAYPQRGIGLTHE